MVESLGLEGEREVTAVCWGVGGGRLRNEEGEREVAAVFWGVGGGEE